ncbi:MAG TPA: membrane protein insertase YidC [Bacillota bacterium]|nr:membrane protein insertase YidC [Bacillota bacterium]
MDIIYQAFDSLLGVIFKLTGDWGITIILLTLVIRILLLPLSIKQKIALEKQQETFKKIEEVKLKLKNQKEKMEQEISQLMQEGSKNFLGCLLTLLQLPVLYSLYQVFSRVPIEATSMIIPWLTSLKAPDPYFVIPALTVLVQLLPNILAVVGFLKEFPKASWSQMAIMSLLGALFFIKAPAAVGIYWIASGIFGVLEQIGYFMFKRKSLLMAN